MHVRQYTRLWLLQQTWDLAGKFRFNLFDFICPDVSMLAQYLQWAVWHTFFNLPFFPKVGFRGMLEWTRMSRSLGFLLAPQVNFDWYRSLVMSDVPRIGQFCLRRWRILLSSLWCSRIKKNWSGWLFRSLASVPCGTCRLAYDCKREGLSMPRACSRALSRESRLYPRRIKASRMISESGQRSWG